MNSNGIASQLILQIIAEEMGLPAGSYWLRDQNKDIPNDQGLYVIAGMIDSAPICVVSRMVDAVVNPNPTNYDKGQNWDGGASQTYDQIPTTQAEISEVQAREMIQVEIVSRSNDALMRNWEIVAALRSIFSTQTQEANQFKICRIPNSFLNTSYAEGAAQLNRYTLTFAAFVWYRKTKVLAAGDYYDDFSTRVDDEASIGSTETNWDTNAETFDTPGQTYDQPQPLAEFEINQEGIEP